MKRRRIRRGCTATCTTRRRRDNKDEAASLLWYTLLLEESKHTITRIAKHLFRLLLQINEPQMVIAQIDCERERERSLETLREDEEEKQKKNNYLADGFIHSSDVGVSGCCLLLSEKTATKFPEHF